VQRLDPREFRQQVIDRDAHTRRHERAMRVLQRHRKLSGVVMAAKD
jgi:hypothetical protein